MIDILAKLSGVAAAGATTAAVAERVLTVQPQPSIFSILVLGIPLGVLAASLVGSSARSFRDTAQPDTSFPRRAVGTIIDGFIGGWLAMFVVGFSYTRPYFEGIEPAVIGAFGGLLVEFIRTNGPRWIEQLWQAALTWISRNKRPEDQAP